MTNIKVNVRWMDGWVLWVIRLHRS